MAATGKTPILLYGSTTATNQPSAGNLTNSSDGCEIAINVADKNLFFKDSTNTVNTVPIRQSSASSNGWLSSTDWSTFNSKQPAGTYVTSVTGTAPVVSSGGTTPAISMAAANGSTNGYLTSTDWTTFNSKAPAFTYTTGYIPFGQGTTTPSQDSNLFWDNTNKRLGLGTTSPTSRLYVEGTIQARSGATGLLLYGTGGSGEISSVGANPLILNVNSAAVMQLAGSGGDVTISTGNLVIGTSGKGIDFSATPGTGTSELLADYEEGTHTATITCGTSGTVTLASTGDLLQYTKVGNIVTVSGDLAVSSVSSPVGYFAISLPFTVSSLSEYASYAPGICVITPSASIAANGYAVTIAAGGTSAIVRTATGTSIANTSAQQLAANADIYFSITYRTA